MKIHELIVQYRNEEKKPFGWSVIGSFKDENEFKKARKRAKKKIVLHAKKYFKEVRLYDYYYAVDEYNTYLEKEKAWKKIAKYKQ